MPLELRRALHAFLPLHPGLQHRRQGLARLSLPDPAGFQQRLLRLWREQERGGAGSAECLQAELQLLLIDLARILLDQGWSEVDDPDPAMAALCARFERDLTGSSPLEQLAAELGLTASSLCRRFKRYAGLSLGGFLLRLRLREACLRLTAGEEPIGALAATCGFTDLAFFARQFKALLGCTPGSYRRRCSPAGTWHGRCNAFQRARSAPEGNGHADL
jgi:AraC-like DNA-binding protein